MKYDLRTVNIGSENRLPPWVVLLFDLGLTLLALGTAYQLRFNFNVPIHEIDLALPLIPIYLIIGGLAMLALGSHRGMLRHSSVDDVKRVFISVVIATVILLIGNTIRFYFIDGMYLLPRSVVIIAGMVSVLLILSVRISAKLLYQRLTKAGKKQENVIIYGTGEAGVLTKRTLERESEVRYKVVAFIDDDKRTIGKRLEGKIIHGPDGVSNVLAKKSVDKLVIAAPKTDVSNRTQIVDACLAQGVELVRVPPVTEWINGQLSGDQLRDVRIEDLLGRTEIHLEESTLKEKLTAGAALVTGAAGSIGQEISRQLAQIGVEKLVLVDIAESALYDLEMEFQRNNLHEDCHFQVADVRNEISMRRLFEKFKPSSVYHAAAYKHVPLMEVTPCEAISTNIGGSLVVAELASKAKCDRFVLISTDKAVNPTSVMGASKRAAEIAIQLIAGSSDTSFVTTRFGNVLGSNGSVIPLFKKQLEAGGPLTVTHPEVTRYFMTIPEACRLVLEAAAMGKGGEIYLFDMGSSVKIKDLAERMIRLSGRTPGVDIDIKYVGLRPGEKLYEELLADEENSLPTHHPRILIGKVKEMDTDTVSDMLDKLTKAAILCDDDAVRTILHSLVPEYKEETPTDSFHQ